jgi:hypothetical protein
MTAIVAPDGAPEQSYHRRVPRDDDRDVASALAEAARVGPFFAWHGLPAAPDGWRPLTDLDDPGVVAERVRVARAALLERLVLAPEDVPVRVVASVVFLGWAARLVSAPLAAVSVAGVLPVPRRDRLWWRPVAGGPQPVGWSEIDGAAAGDTDDVAAAFAEGILGRLVVPLLTVFEDRFRLSPKVLYGNVASALGGAVAVLRGARPDRSDRAGRVLEALLADGPLAGSASVRRPQWTLRRNNCCLYYRIPGGGYCGDCVLPRGR